MQEKNKPKAVITKVVTKDGTYYTSSLRPGEKLEKKVTKFGTWYESEESKKWFRDYVEAAVEGLRKHTRELPD